MPGQSKDPDLTSENEEIACSGGIRPFLVGS